MSGSKSGKGASRLGNWLITAFTGIFVAVGVGVVLFLLVPTLLTAWQAKDWTPVRAQLISTALQISHGSKGGTTSRVVARYRYVIAGQAYESERVGLIGGSDNIGDWQAETHARLRRALEGDGRITVYVNPDDPAEAIIDRSPRWGQIALIGVFALVFSGFGLGFMFLFRRSASEAARKEQERAAIGVGGESVRFSHGVEVHSSRRSEVVVMWVFTLLWNAISLPAAGLALVRVDGPMGYLILLFPLAGILLLLNTLARHREWRRFGRVPLRMDPWPGAIGGDMAGSLDLPLPFDTRNRFRVTLACLHSETRGSGSDRSQHESVCWECEGVPVARSGPQGTRLLVRFRVPAGLPASEPVAASYHLWRLQVDGEVPGVDFNRRYEIEMQPGEALSQAHARLPYSDENAGPPRLPPEVVTVRDDARGRILDFRAGRNLRPGLALALFGAVFLAAGLFMARPANDVPLFFSGLFILVGALILLAGLWLAFNRLRVILGAQTVITERYFLGLPLFSRRAARADLVALERRQSMSANNGERTTVWYSIVLLTQDGRKLTVADTVRGSALSLALGRQIGERLGLPLAGDDAGSAR